MIDQTAVSSIPTVTALLASVVVTFSGTEGDVSAVVPFSAAKLEEKHIDIKKNGTNTTFANSFFILSHIRFILILISFNLYQNFIFLATMLNLITKNRATYPIDIVSITKYILVMVLN
ncbi:MAG: hypothetical protein AMJ61_04205 [Desulfobacterales bacterium SG8_35_2]|nr:MAG: hypothetical protein AMJ61_04205 [Desulfobacterales bacterium SG8_35_2]